jgi:hypothetical protein
MSTVDDWRAKIFSATLLELQAGFRQLESKVPPPIRQRWRDGFVFRYKERSVQQAIVQKLARLISGLHAIQALLDRGLFQEQAMIQRVCDEIGEDIQFLSLSIIKDDLTQRHRDYLEYFYAEEFEDPTDVTRSHKSRGMVPRDKIRAYTNKWLEGNAEPANVAGRIITKAYSGFVHAASPHVMDMCGGSPPKFDVSGKFWSLRRREFGDDALNYFLRATYSFAFAAKAFGDEALFESLSAAAGELEKKKAAHQDRQAL